MRDSISERLFNLTIHGRYRFDEKSDLKEALDAGLTTLWERSVIAPLMHLTEEHAPEGELDNVIEFPMAAPA